MNYDIHKLAAKFNLSDTEMQILDFIIKHSDTVLDKSVREVAALNYTSAATVIKLSKKMGYTGYVDMVYRLHFTMKNRKRKEVSSGITSFISEMDKIVISQVVELLCKHQEDIIYLTATGFSFPLAEYFYRKMLVRGFRCIQTNAYGVYDSNQIGGKMVIAISKSGETDSITKVIDFAKKNHLDIISFTGQIENYISKKSTVNVAVIDDKSLDDRNVTANYFYARVMILFEYIMDEYVKKSTLSQ